MRTRRVGVLALGVVVLAVCGTSMASLGWWQEGAPGSTHEFWDFTPGYIVQAGNGYTADPEIVSNPRPSRVAATITGGTWDGKSVISSSVGLFVSLEIPNYEIANAYKEIWVDIGNAIPTDIAVSATGSTGSTSFRYTLLPGQGDAEFGIRIEPNPYVEKIDFTVLPSVTGAPALLDYINIDTICTPEPATLCLMGLGSLALLRKRTGK